MDCSVIDCNRTTYSKGLCAMHYKRAWRHGDPTVVQEKIYVGQDCSVEDCQQPARANGMCRAHNARVYRRGSTEAWRRPNGSGTYSESKYVLITINGIRKYEHVHIAEKALGRPLPPGAIVHHMNENKADNHTPFNLVICPNQNYHMLIHARMRRLIR